MPNITRGGDARGLLRYLAGPGRADEHVDPRLVAGSTAAMAWGPSGRLDLEGAGTVARLLDTHVREFGVRTTVAVKDADGQPCGQRDAHVWHCSLSLHPDEQPLSVAQWATVSEDFVADMGFAGGDDADCQWVAVRSRTWRRCWRSRRRDAAMHRSGRLLTIAAACAGCSRRAGPRIAIVPNGTRGYLTSWNCRSASEICGDQPPSGTGRRGLDRLKSRLDSRESGQELRPDAVEGLEERARGAASPPLRSEGL